MIEIESFFEELFNKFRILTPKAAQKEHIELLLGVKFGKNQNESYLLVSKLERVLFDLGFIYVNIAKMLKHEDAEKN